MTMTAKIVLQSKVESGEDADRVAALHFQADYADDRNKEWARWTPALGLTMTVKGSLADRLSTGQKFLLTFSEER